MGHVFRGYVDVCRADRGLSSRDATRYTPLSSCSNCFQYSKTKWIKARSDAVLSIAARETYPPGATRNDSAHATRIPLLPAHYRFWCWMKTSARYASSVKVPTKMRR